MKTMPRFFKVFGPYQGRWFDLTAILDSRQITVGVAYAEAFVEIHLPFLTLLVEW